MANSDSTVRECVSCGSTFARYKRRITCSSECQAERNRLVNLAGYHRRQSAGTVKRNPRDLVCPMCGESFKGKSGSKYCSRECQWKSQVTRPPKKSVFRRRAERIASRAAEGTSGGGLTWVQGPCAVCCAPFIGRGVSARYCSESCRKMSRWNRGDWIDAKARVAIYKRDSWTCQICLRPVRPSAGHLTDWYPSLDHIIPRSRGGDDGPNNLQTAHRICNSIRRDQPMWVVQHPSQMKLILTRVETT